MRALSQLASLTDLAALPLPAGLAERLLRQAEWEIERVANEQDWDRLLRHGSREAIIAKACDHYGGAPDMFGLRSDYPGKSVNYAISGRHNSHPRAPVFMRGSVCGMLDTYGGKNHLAISIFKRFIRAKRITALDREEFEQKVSAAISKLCDRWNCSYHFHNWIAFPLETTNGLSCYIGGRLVFLDNNQASYVRKLQAILRKNANLESGVAKARAQAMSARQSHDPQGHGPKDASAVRQDAPKGDHP